MNYLVFDIETVPDVSAGRAIHNISNDLDDAGVAKAMFHLQAQKTGREFLPHHLQQIVAISLVYRGGADSIKVLSLGTEASDEGALIQQFFDGIDRYSPTLISWNGGGFDLPVLHYRALLHKISAPRYWESGDSDQSFKWNNYQSRYHSRHTDVMDVLAMYTGRANAPLDELATMLGFPGKLGMSGAKVWDEYLSGNLTGIRQYCETDVLNTWLVFLRFQLLRGRIGSNRHEEETELLKTFLANQDEAHFKQFLDAWSLA